MKLHVVVNSEFLEMSKNCTMQKIRETEGKKFRKKIRENERDQKFQNY